MPLFTLENLKSNWRVLDLGKRKINKNIPRRVVVAACRGIVVVALWIR